jgi:hypothetical protein
VTTFGFEDRLSTFSGKCEFETEKLLLATKTWTLKVPHTSAPGLLIQRDVQHLLLRDKSESTNIFGENISRVQRS